MPCKFHSLPGGCKKSDEACDFRHDPKPRQRRVSELSRPSDDESSTRSRRNGTRSRSPEDDLSEDDSVVEIPQRSKEAGRRSFGGGARRYSEDEEDAASSGRMRGEKKKSLNQGNERGAGLRPRGTAPSRSSREEVRGQGSGTGRSVSAARKTSPLRKRKYSPTRSPSEEGRRQRRRGDREESEDREQTKRARKYLLDQVKKYGGDRRSEDRDGPRGGTKGKGSRNRSAPRRR